MQELSQKQIGRRIKSYREQKKLRVKAVAEKLKVTRQHVYAIERGDTALTMERLQQFSSIFNVSTDELLGRRQKRSA